MLLLSPPILTLNNYINNLNFVFLTDSKYVECAKILNTHGDNFHFQTYEYSGKTQGYEFKKHIKYDIAFDFQATDESVSLFHSLPAERKIGFTTSNTDSHSYTDFLSPRNCQSLSASYYMLFRLVWPELPIEHIRIPRLRKGRVKKIGFAPGGSVACKRWAIRKWEELSKKIEIMFPNIELHLISEENSPNLNNIACRYWHFGKSLPEIQSILQCLDLIVANESALMHLAATNGCPTIGLFGFGNLNIWSSYSDIIYPIKNDYRCKKNEKADCENLCSLPSCLETISVDQVANAVRNTIATLEA